MAKQFKSILVYPVAHNTVKVITDQTDLSIESAENKILCRAPDHFPINKETIHAHVKETPGNVNSVPSLNPLVVKTSGYANTNIDGYDGFLVNPDGTKYWRGVIKTNEVFESRLYNPAYYSDGDHYWLIGGINLEEDGYVNSVFHSIDGLGWELQESPPFDARSNSLVLGNGTGDLWLIGGSDYGGFKKDIWHGSINTTSGVITWDGAALVTNQSELNKYIKNGGYGNFNDPVLFINDLIFNLGTETFTTINGMINMQDGYGNIKFYDQDRNIYSNSNDQLRTEWIFDSAHDVTDVIANPFCYTHLESTDSSTWNFTHDLNKTEVVVACFDDENNILSPSSTSITNKDITLNFSTPVSGRAFALDGYSVPSGTTWVIDGYELNQSSIFCCNTTWDIIEPTTITRNSSSQFTLTWNAATGGFISIMPAYLTGNVRSRKYISELSIFTPGSNIIVAKQFNPSIYNIRNSFYELITPNSISWDSDGTNINLLGLTTARYGAGYMRYDGYNDLTDPFNNEYINIGYNSQNNNTAYLLGDNGVWRSSDNGVSYVRHEAENLTLPTDRLVPLLVNNSSVATLQKEYLSVLSQNSGDSWTDPGTNELGSSFITFYGRLGSDIDTTWNIFVYNKPSDVIWESNYNVDNEFPETLLDDFSTNYILPYPATITSNSSQNVKFTLDTEFGDNFTLDELKGSLLYLLDDDGYTVEKQEIIGNSIASAGEEITLFTNEFTNIPLSGDRIQIISLRPEGTNYYSVLTRNETFNYDIYTEDDGISFLETQERVYDYYANRVLTGVLPEYIRNENNDNKLSLLQTELDRLRVTAGQHYYDPYTLPPEFLDRLGSQIGVNISDLPLKTQRRVIASWFNLINQYGWCLEGLQNLRDLILGQNQVSITIQNPNSDVLSGLITNIELSSYSDNTWDYVSATNIIKYDSDLGNWYMVVDSSDIVSTIKVLKNNYLVHFNKTAVDGPFRVLDHVYNDIDDTYKIYFNSSEIFDITFDEGTSVLAIYNKPKKDLIFKFIDLVNGIKPHWSNVFYS